MSTQDETLARLLTKHAWYVDDHVRGVCLGCLDETRQLRQFPTVGEFAAHLVELIDATYLVAPRSDIVGTEYGYRSSDEDLACLTDDRKDAINGALGRRQWQRDAMFQPTAEAVERPSLPWSPIPLPEDESER